MNRSTITKRDAERVLAAVKAQGKAYLAEDGSGPTLREDWDWTGSGHPATFSIVWEEGPYDWAYTFPFGGVNEEMTSLMQEFRPGHVSRSSDMSDRIPSHLFCEAITSWAIGLYLI